MDLEEQNTYENPVKIFIRDIHKLKRNENDTNYYHFHDKLIRKVDILGVVTEVRKMNDFYLYRVDDCTGEILCRYNHFSEKNLQEVQETEQLEELVAAKNFQQATESGAAMESILGVIFKKSKLQTSPLEQGECAHVQGFISDFFGTREIWAFSLYKVLSSAHEVDRVFELSALYSNVYSRLDGV